MSLNNEWKVLSIQSHVVSGYCGNKSAVFPLQTLGFNVDFINTVQFSTHTGYPKWTGNVLNEHDLLELYSGLKSNNLHLRYTHILSGYARSASFLHTMHSIIKEIKCSNTNTIYLCDPVLGDNGKMYVPEELMPIYRDKIIPLADIICPNQFEAEILSKVKIMDMKTALEAIDKLHEFGIQTVVISSIDEKLIKQNQEGATEKIITIASSLVEKCGKKQRFIISCPKVDAHFTGTGDLFAALFLAWFSMTDFDLKLTLENVICSLQAIIQRTYTHAIELPGGLTSVANKELRIIESRNDLIKPNITIHCEAI